MNLVNLSEWSRGDVLRVWELAGQSILPPIRATIGWSFEGNGVRTRASFMQAFRDLSATCIELPNLLKTRERLQDLAGYLDPFISLYVIREADHARLTEFAEVSSRPVINAMSSVSHPCEVLTDAWYIHQFIRPIDQARICLWGPTTNVFHAWHELAQVLGLTVTQVCDRDLDVVNSPNVKLRGDANFAADVVITDATGECSAGQPLTAEDLQRLGQPKLLPTPPFMIGRELSFDPVTYPGFVGYGQKQFLLPVQRAILAICMGAS